MQLFEIIIGLLLAGVALAALARRMGAPYPALVALAGAALAAIPGTPALVLDPGLALALFVAPVLLDAAFDASLRDLRANWRPVAGLAIGAVAITIVAVALVVRTVVPEMSWAAAITLGAIVAPPDAAAATAVLKQLRPPYRLMVILEGESLFNDASALLVYRLGVGAASAGAVVGWEAIPMLLAVTGGSVVLGFAASRAIFSVSRRIREFSTAVIVQFCGTFGVWLLAERLRLSGILTMVVFAMVTSRTAPDIIPARIRIPSYAVWEVVVFILNVLAFILIGLQLRPILAHLDRSEWLHYVWVAAAVCGAAMLARLAWVSGVAGLSAWRCHDRRHRGPGSIETVALSPRAAALVGWCGMRGIVTLAAALALPETFPHRDLILFTSFAVVLATLVVQGLTLKPIMMRLKLGDDRSVEREVQLARVETLGAALNAAAASQSTEIVEAVRRRYELELHRANAELDGGANGATQLLPPEDVRVIRSTIAAERQKLLALRADGTIGDAAFQRLEQELDLRELDLQQLLREE